jgi:hypothetical protein
MHQPPITALLAVDDQRRPSPHAAGVARRLGIQGDIPVTTYTIEPDDDTPVDIADLVANRDRALLVIDVHGGGFPGDRLRDADAEAALGADGLPVLALGPRANTRSGPASLVVAIDRSAPQAAALDFGTRWRNTFHPAKVVVVLLDAPSGWSEDEVTDDIAVGHGFDGLVEHVVTLDPSRSIGETAAMHEDPVIVVASPRSPSASHWFATARRLIRTAPCPVVVVPGDG